MKTHPLHVIVVILGCMFACSNLVKAQTNAKETYEIKRELKLELLSDVQWINRFYKDMNVFKEKDKEVKNFLCDVLFIGSSSIRMWDTLKEDMAPLKVVNRGYGGATVRDMFYNYNTIFSKYKPRKIVFYCDNDISCGQGMDLTTLQTLDLYRAFFQTVVADYPGVPVYFLSIKYCKSRWALKEEEYILNTLMKEYAEQTPDMYFVDVSSGFLDAEGQLIDDYFKEDNLHLNKKGYEVWTNRLKPLLVK